MSLGGLDSSAIAEAHRTAVAEVGGWFLLKYVNRDTVDLLGTGTGGAAEVRSAIEQYEQKSPLFGLLHYRKKKVVLKYVPEGTSRLLQVRLTVQFQSVLDTFIPHDAVFSFTGPAELNDSSLAANTMLLSSTNSITSSESSLRKRHLGEIAEGVEMGTTSVDESTATVEIRPAVQNLSSPKSQQAELHELPASAILAKQLLAKRKQSEQMETLAKQAIVTSSLLTIPIPLLSLVERANVENTQPSQQSNHLAYPSTASLALQPSIDKSLPATPESTPPRPSRSTEKDFDNEPPLSYIPPPAPSTQNPDVRERSHSRHLSLAESDSISQWSRSVVELTLPQPKKKKLGPRPHIEPLGRQAHSEDHSHSRPVSNLPTTIRVSNRPLTSQSHRPGSQHSSRSVPARLVHRNMSPAPSLPDQTHVASMYRTHDIRESSRASSIMTENTIVAPEKLRLMKALQIRKRQQMLAQRASTLARSTAYADEAAGQAQDLSSDTKSSISSTRSESNDMTAQTPVSDRPSTTATSFTLDAEGHNSKESLSTETASSATPKAAPERPNTLSIVTAQSSTEPISSVKVPDSLHHYERSMQDIGTIEEEGQEDGAEEIAQPTKSPIDEAFERLNGGLASSVPDAQMQNMAQSDIGTKPGTAKPVHPHRQRQYHTGSTRPLSSSTGSDIDELADELQNATVHEAKHVSVARSPVTTIISKNSSDRLRDISCSESSSEQKLALRTTTPPETNGSRTNRSPSALPQWAAADPMPVPLTKKQTLGTGISKRIKALEVITSREQSTPAPQSPRDPNTPRSILSTFMKRSSWIHTHGQHPSFDLGVSDQHIPETKEDPRLSKEHQPRRDSVAELYARHQKRSSISVTARIVRDEDKILVSTLDRPSELHLHRSPLVVEHGRDEGQLHMSKNPSVQTTELSFQSPQSSRRKPSFTSDYPGSPPRLPHSESMASRISLASNKSRARKAPSENSSVTEDKSKTPSRAQRFMNRVTNLTTGRKKNNSKSVEDFDAKSKARPATIPEHLNDYRKMSVAESVLDMVDIGDVNVQFPETLLWKRRFMQIDEHGYVVFSAPTSEPRSKAASRKFHLTDLRMPSLPGAEREERAAYSVILDTYDGKSIQCACGSSIAQQQILQMLVDAHSAYQQLYA